MKNLLVMLMLSLVFNPSFALQNFAKNIGTVVEDNSGVTVGRKNRKEYLKTRPEENTLEGEDAFITKDVTVISQEAFKHKVVFGLSFEVGSRLVQIAQGAFIGTSLMGRIEFPNNLEMISSWAFAGNPRISEIIFSERNSKLAEIGENAFIGCVRLRKVIFPYNLKKICRGAFAGCISLKEVTLSPTVEVEPGAFESLTRIKRAEPLKALSLEIM
ncbi:MAG: leucine-rich repeat domain-containing protein [Holosporaceae bacterium]|jgi:hypothetical protein|nr:leucine-rich repeat domain-containing protein [Holosporaceae bacterium]